MSGWGLAVQRIAPWSTRLQGGIRAITHSLSLSLFTLLILVSLLAPLLAPYDPLQPNTAERLQPPNLQHLFGTDRLGFDVFSRVVHAARVDLFIAISSVLISIALGLPIGVVVGYVGGRLDAIAMRVFDIFQAFPILVLAIGVLAALGRGLLNVVLVIAILGLPTYVRLVRGQVRSLREMAYVEAARSVGNPPARLVARYLVPGTLGTLAIQAGTSAGWALILTAALGFLGLGVPIPQPEWGYMISTGVSEMTNGDWWISIFPGLAIVVSVFTFNLVGETIADLVDPRRRRTR